MSDRAEEVFYRWDVWMRKCGELLRRNPVDIHRCGAWYDMRDPTHPYHGKFSVPADGPIVCASCFHKNMMGWTCRD